MRVALIGADFEENLGLGTIAAVAERAGHAVHIFAFNRPEDAPALARELLRVRPAVVGLSMQFQHRAHEFLALARRLRAAGYRGHITAGGQFPSLAYAEVLGRDHGVDSVVLYDGEESFAALLEALSAGSGWDEVPGLAVRTHDGVVRRTPDRGLVADLDRVPFPLRYRAHTRHLGVPFIPLMGSRGCWGHCSYCAITSFYREAHAHGGGQKLRLRSPENIAEEMAALHDRAGGSAIFCFHDDNLLLPKPSATLARMEAIRAALDAYGVGPVGLVGKCRPDTVTPELAQRLAALGVIRLYVGVENGSEAGADHLGRGTQQRAVHAALHACRDAGIFVCYNLLLFEPRATLEDVAENVAFIRAHPEHPVNFCRAEPYFGTPIHRDLEAQGTLGGSYLGFNYRIEDDRTELLFRVAAAAFRERNFAPSGVANRYMGLGYLARVLARFYQDGDGRIRALGIQATELTRAISLETAGFLERALELVRMADLADRDRLEQKTALLGLEIAAADQRRHAELDAFRAEADGLAARAARLSAGTKNARAVPRLLRAVGLGAALSVWGAGCSCEQVIDPLPSPTDGGRDGGRPDAGDRPDTGRDAGGEDVQIVDPPPPDAAMDAGDMDVVLDPLPPDAAMDAGGEDIQIVDPPPPDAAMDAGGEDIQIVDPAPADAAIEVGALDRRRLPVLPVDRWTDTTPRRARRAAELPLFDPPELALKAVRRGQALEVELSSREPASVRWEAEGLVTGEGLCVSWRPSGASDRLRVAVRTRGGVTVASLGADESA